VVQEECSNVPVTKFSSSTHDLSIALTKKCCQASTSCAGSLCCDVMHLRWFREIHPNNTSVDRLSRSPSTAKLEHR
jgi:hypothetical protein